MLRNCYEAAAWEAPDRRTGYGPLLGFALDLLAPWRLLCFDDVVFSYLLSDDSNCQKAACSVLSSSYRLLPSHPIPFHPIPSLTITPNSRLMRIGLKRVDVRLAEISLHLTDKLLHLSKPSGPAVTKAKPPALTPTGSSAATSATAAAGKDEKTQSIPRLPEAVRSAEVPKRCCLPRCSLPLPPPSTPPVRACHSRVAYPAAIHFTFCNWCA